MLLDRCLTRSDKVRLLDDAGFGVTDIDGLIVRQAKPASAASAVSGASAMTACRQTPPQLQTISARTLQETDLPPLVFVVGSILPQGLGLLVAPSKYGKSWLALGLCIAVALGVDFLGYPTSQGGALYLALEDGYRRLKDRMKLILDGQTAPDNFHMATAAATIDSGLAGQIAGHLKAYPDTKLVVIDVLERVRGASTKNTSAYATDYRDMGELKRIADENNICVLVIHHTRKMRDEGDVYNMISGTNGIMGSADTIWVMQRENRDDLQTKLHVTGRDIEQQSLVVTMNRATHRWERIGTVEEQAQVQAREAYESDPAVRTIKALLKENGNGFELSSTDFFAEMGSRAGDYGQYTPATLGKRFQNLAPLLLRYDRIVHNFVRTSKGKRHRFAPYREAPRSIQGEQLII